MGWVLRRSGADSTLYIVLMPLRILSGLIGHSHVPAQGIRNQAPIVRLLSARLLIRRLELRPKDLRLMNTLQVAIERSR